MGKHCRDCRFAKCKPFSGEIVWNARVRKRRHMGELGALMDSTRFHPKPLTVGPVRCTKGCWIYFKDPGSKQQPTTEKTIVSVRNLLRKDNMLGHMAQVCEHFDDMREDE